MLAPSIRNDTTSDTSSETTSETTGYTETISDQPGHQSVIQERDKFRTPFFCVKSTDHSDKVFKSIMVLTFIEHTAQHTT